jgi:hypothetical protein
MRTPIPWIGEVLVTLLAHRALKHQPVSLAFCMLVVLMLVLVLVWVLFVLVLVLVLVIVPVLVVVLGLVHMLFVLV